MITKSLSSPQIALIMKKGKAYNSGFFLLKTLDLKSVPDIDRLRTKQNPFSGSFIASKKVLAKAVDRNKAKRILKESFNEAVKRLKNKGLDICTPHFVFLAKTNTINGIFSNIVDEIEQILVKDYIIIK